MRSEGARRSAACCHCSECEAAVGRRVRVISEARWTNRWKKQISERISDEGGAKGRMPVVSSAESKSTPTYSINTRMFEQ